jgi:tetratricopeptide (TPR) repeat protein
MGTPGYMAPEQARGEPADARADVFALGAILAAILTGKPAFVGTTARETIEKAARGDLSETLERLASSGADPELVALAKDCLAADPSSRPADAKQLAERVANYRLGVEQRLKQAETAAAEVAVREVEQRKRRRVLTSSVTTVVIALAAGLGISHWQMNRAIAAEGRAKTDRDDKDRALEAMTDAYSKTWKALQTVSEDVFENQLARNGTLTEEMKQYLQKLVGQFEALANVHAHDIISRNIQFEGRARVAHLRHRLGDSLQAIADAERMLAEYTDFVERYSEFKELRRNLAFSYGIFGDMCLDLGRSEEAEKAHAAARRFYGQMGEDFLELEESRHEVATAAFDHARSLERCGRYEEALDAFAECERLLKHLIIARPTSEPYHFALGACLQNHGLCLKKLLRSSDGEPLLREAVAHFKQSVALNPSKLKSQAGLANAEDALCNVLMDQGKVKDPLAEHMRRVSRHLRLIAQFPSNVDFREKLAIAYFNYGCDLEDAAKADEAFAAALAHFKRLAADFPESRVYLEGVAKTLTSRGERLSRFGRRQEALTALHEGLAIRRRLLKQAPEDVATLGNLSNSLNEISKLHFAAGDWGAAEKHLVEAASIENDRVRLSRAHPEVSVECARVHSNLGALRYKEGKFEDALAAFQSCLEVERKTFALDPNNLERHLQLMISLRNNAAALSKVGRHDQAVSAYREVVSLGTRLASGRPPVRRYAFELARGHRELGLALLTARRPTEADAAFAEAAKTFEQVVVDDPRHVEALVSAATSLVQRARLSALNGDWRSAALRLDDAKLKLDAASKIDSASQEVREASRNWLVQMSCLWAGRLDSPKAVQAGSQIRDFGLSPPDDAYDAACAMALCSAVASGHPKLSAEQRKAAARLYGDEALTLLRTAVAKGWCNSQHLERDQDLDSLRERKDFKGLAAELRSKSATNTIRQ